MELKQCPFCGESPELKDYRLVWVVECKCGASVSGDRAPEPEQDHCSEYWQPYIDTAVISWNSRN